MYKLFTIFVCCPQNREMKGSWSTTAWCFVVREIGVVGRLPVQYSIAGQSAIGYTLILLWGIGGFLSSFQVGTQAITARRFGGGDSNGAGRTLSNSLVLTITTSTIAAVGAFFVIEYSSSPSC